MADYATFTANRSTVPNWPALVAALRAAVDGTVGVSNLRDGTWRMKKDTTWTAPQIAAAQTALDTCAADTLQLQAQQKIDSMDIFDKAIILTLIDELNILRGLHSLAARTVPQAIAAVRTKAGTL